MSRRAASLTFLGIAAALAGLLFAGAIPPLAAGCLFAVVLVIFGAASRGFTR